MFNFLPAIDRYIFKLVIVPMLGVFAIAASLLTLDKMLRLLDFVAVEGGPVGVVFKMLYPQQIFLVKIISSVVWRDRPMLVFMTRRPVVR